MAQKRLKSMIFPGLSDTYTVPQALSDLMDYSDFTDAQQDIVDLQTGLTAAEESVTTYVVGNTNTTGVQLDPGTYVWVKNHSVLTDGLYTVGSTAIVQGGSVVDTNMNAVSEGGLNDLKNTLSTKNCYSNSEVKSLICDGSFTGTGGTQVALSLTNITNGIITNNSKVLCVSAYAPNTAGIFFNGARKSATADTLVILMSSAVASGDTFNLILRIDYVD